MKSIKIIITVVLYAVVVNANAQFTDEGSYSYTLDDIAIGYSNDPGSAGLALTVNGFAYFNGGLFCKALRPGNPDGFFEFGYGSNGGANISMYKSNHASRPGDLAFVYGGGDMGALTFTHYNGTSWSNNMILTKNGFVGIGSNNPTHKLTVNGGIYSESLSVNGKITTKEVEVTLDGWSDYVFNEDYELSPLSEVEAFIKKNKHLPGIPSEKEILENGLSVGKMNQKMMEKIEELTLYVIELEKEINKLKNN